MANQIAKSSLFKKIKSATVAIALYNYGDRQVPFTILGTGFCIHPRGIIVSCEHVFSAFMQRSVQEHVANIPKELEKKKFIPHESGINVPHAVFFDTQYSKHKMRAIPAPMDIATIKTDYDIGMMRIQPSLAFPKGFPSLEIEEFDQIYEGMEIAICGFPLGNYLSNQIGTITSSFTKGILSSIIPMPGCAKEHLSGFQLDITATHGNSGGPVFNIENGKVFGVLQRGVVDQQDKLLPGIVKAEPVYPLIEKNLLESILTDPSGI